MTDTKEIPKICIQKTDCSGFDKRVETYVTVSGKTTEEAFAILEKMKSKNMI